MSITLSETIEIKRPVEEVFAYVTDLRNDPEWQKGLAEATYTSDGPVDIGTTGVHRAGAMGVTVEIGWEIYEYEESKRASWKFVSGPFEGNENYVLESTPTGTKFMHSAELQPKGVLRFLAPVAGGLFAKQSAENVRTLKRILESR